MQSKTVRSRVSLALLPAIFLITACGEEKKKEPTCEESQAAVSTASFDQLWTNVFSTQCVNCHGVASNTKTLGGPDMTTKDKFYDALVGKKGSDYVPAWSTFDKNRTPECSTVSFIAAGSAATSMVVGVLDPSVALPSNCTIVSHVQAGSEQNICITSANLAKLKEWIDAGASK